MNEAIQLTRLPSGLTVVTERMDRVETVSLGAYVATGSRHEQEPKTASRTSSSTWPSRAPTRRSAAQIAEEIEAVGGHINAYTAREQTAYYVKVLKEDTALAADIIGDILTHSTFEPEELERERGVILQEIGQANDTPDDIIFDHFQECAYPDQPIGRPVLGSEDGIRAMPRTMLTGYMRRHYAASNMVVAAAGALTHEQMLDLVNVHFADLPADPLPAMTRRATAAASSARRAISTRCISCWASPRSATAIAIITRRCCSPRCWAAACRRGCSRKSGRSAGWSIRSTRSARRTWMAGCSASTPAPARARPRN